MRVTFIDSTGSLSQIEHLCKQTSHGNSIAYLIPVCNLSGLNPDSLKYSAFILRMNLRKNLNSNERHLSKYEVADLKIWKRHNNEKCIWINDADLKLYTTCEIALIEHQIKKEIGI